MSTNYGQKTEEAIHSCEHLLFKGVPLISNKAIPNISGSQFFTILENNLSCRLFTMQASNVSVRDNQFKDQYTQLLTDLDVLDQTNWPDNCDIQYGDSSVRRLVKIFQVDERSTIRGFREFKDTKNKLCIQDLNPLLTAIKTIAISSSECEWAFSTMNNLVTTKRNALSSNHISSLMFINCVGPPVQKFKPESYVLSWMRRGKRSAEEECCSKRNNTEVSEPYL